MKKLLILIKACKECPKCIKEPEPFCSRCKKAPMKSNDGQYEYKKIPDIKEVPEWCPLEDA